MQSVSSSIWTRVAVFISYDDNHYTTGTSFVQNCRQISFILSWGQVCSLHNEEVTYEFLKSV